MTSTQSTSTSDPIWDEALGRIKRRIDDTLASGLAGFPHYGEPATGQWVTTADGSWTGGFWVGELWLAGHYWSDPVYAREAERWLRKLESRIESKSVFRGFLFYYGAVPGASVAKNPYAREIVLRSGATLAKAFNSTVGLIPLGTAAEEAHSVGDDKTNIDSLIASPLLLRAANANGDASLRRIALAHALIFQCRLFGDTPYLPARARRRERPSSIVRPKNEIAEAPPSRRERVGLIAGRSADHLNVGRAADRRRWVGAALAHEDSARAGLTVLAITLIFQCRLFGDTPYLPARARRRERPSSIVRPEPNFSKMESARSSAGGTSGSR